MAQTFVLHADDIGLSCGITDSILRSIDEGSVRSVSLICNGTALDEAVLALRARPAVRVSLHLNLLEGRPLSEPRDIPLLVDAEGQLVATFQRLVTLWVRGDARRRTALGEQMQGEFAAQISRGCAALAAAGRPVGRLRIDSHTHIHALGFVLDAILACAGSQKIGYVRVPREPWHIGWGASDARTVLGLNIVKWGLLNRLSRGMTQKLEARGIAFNRGFLGVLHTGRVTVSAIEAGVQAILESQPGEALSHDSQPVEVLLHPGKAEAAEEGQWRGRPELWAYYRSENRELEAQTARDIGSSPLLSAHFRGV